LLILTDVDAVYADWGTPQQRELRRLSADEAVEMDRAGAFGEGSMAPKIRAAVDLRAARRTRDHHGAERGREAVRGEAGTTITVEKA
jgi:carbamate kinase